MSNKENEPIRVRMSRIIPQFKIYEYGTLLKTKQDLYYSLEEDIVETGGEDNLNAFSLQGGSGVANSFPMSDMFLHKEKTVMLLNVAQFIANDGYVYIRANLLSENKLVWVNILKMSRRKWDYMIRSERKTKIKEQVEEMFTFIQD